MAFGIIAIFYILFVLWLYKGLKKALAPLPVLASQDLTFSVVIPVRNEEGTIQMLLQDLSIQSYSIANFEVIVVDDHSTDATLQHINALQLPYKLSVLQASREGKKQAIEQGVAAAKNEIILTTDGDCRVQKDWIASYAASYTPQLEVVFGTVTFYKEATWFQKMQTIEFASLIGSGMATLSNGYASMCNGANFSFRKATFFRLKGYEEHKHIASGDDEFLMHQVFQNNPASVGLNTAYEGVVFTTAATSFNSFLQQRKRWASKWGSYTLKFPKRLAAVVFLFTLSFALAPVFGLFGVVSLEILVTSFTAKFCMDFFFIHKMMAFYKKRLSLFLFLQLSILYLLYVPLVGILGSFGKYNWKERIH